MKVDVKVVEVFDRKPNIAPPKPPGYPPLAEQILYYRAVMGEKWVSEGMTTFLTTCPFRPHLDHHFTVYLERTRWSCMECQAEGDIFAVQARLTEIAHLRASIARVWETMAEAKEAKACGSNQSSD